MKQEYEKYSVEDFLVWRKLFDTQMAQLPQLADKAYLEGIEKIEFRADKIPNFDEMNKLLGSITGWEVVVVKGLIPEKEFFELLLNRKFPSSTWLRKMEELGYLEEPDMFHDTFGHVPILTNQDFCDFLQGLSKIALKHIDDAWAIELLSRVYWFTVEFGLIRQKEGLKIYGAGILSSESESVYCLSDEAVHLPYDIGVIYKTPYIKHKFQERYFVIESYKQLYNSLPAIESLLEKELTVKQS